VALQDADLQRQQEQARRDQSGTYLSHTHADEIGGGGRFGSVNAATVVGAQPLSLYPQLPSSSPWSGTDPVGQEPPLGFEVGRSTPHELEPSLALGLLFLVAGRHRSTSQLDSTRAQLRERRASLR
jgi:hypothetical protein